MTTRNGKPYKTGEFALTPTEYDRLLESCSSIEDETLIKFTVATGLRRADIVRVEIQNVIPETGKVTFSEKKKGGRIRTIYIGPKLRQLVIKYLKTIPKNQKMLFGFSERTAYNKLQHLCDIAGIPRRPFHALRATCMKRCQRAGWTPEQVVDLTGDTLRVIQEHYSTPSSSEMQEVSVNKEIV
jgi:integrase